MNVEIKAGWIYALRQLAAVVEAGEVSTKPEVVALTPIAAPATATAADVATLLNEVIAALQA
jgi:hypothetical protein